MKTIKLHIIFYILLATILSACSDDDEGKQALPKVLLKNGSIQMNSISITVIPSNATRCAYAYFVSTELPPSAENVLAEGTAIESTGESCIEISNLNWDTRYTLKVAAANSNGELTSTSMDFVVGKDISAGWTEGANCYVVPAAGTYHFSAKKVSGTPIEHIEKVDWIWSSKVGDETSQALLENIQFQDGEVHFTATGKEGNIVLAGFDATEKIVWSWHIWCTDEPFSMTHSNGSVFMDRCLGATGSSIRDGEQIRGLLYQWGRKDPFYGGSKHEMMEEQEIPFSVANVETLMNPSYNLQWKYVNEAVELETAVNNPMNMYYHQDAFNWHLKDDDTLWGKEKTDYDPCPQGYRVPTIQELSSLKDGIRYVSDHLYVYNYEGYNGYWPGQGAREANTGIYTLSTALMTWSCTPMTDTGYERMIFRVVVNANIYTDVQGMGCKAMGQVIRCVSEK